MFDELQTKKTRSPNKTTDERKAEISKAIKYHEDCIVKLKEKLDNLDKPKMPRMSKRQLLFIDKINSGALTIEEAKALGYKY